MKLIFQIAGVLLLVSSASLAQELQPPLANIGLSVEVETVEVVTVKQQVERSVVRFGQFENAKPDVIVSESTSNEKAVGITVSEPATVQGFSSSFEPAELSQFGNTWLLTGKPGRYLVIVNTATSSTIRIATIEPTKPIEPPKPDVSELSKFSADLAAKLNDKVTAEALSSSIMSRLYNLTAPEVTFEEATHDVLTAIETTLSARTGDSRYVDWLNGFRRPVQAKLTELNVTTVSAYVDAMRQVAYGLSGQVSGQVSGQAGGAAATSATPFVAMLQPQWTEPAGPHFVGQIHNGRQLISVCTNGICRLVWRVVQ